jgi:hypothetical protein
MRCRRAAVSAVVLAACVVPASASAEVLPGGRGTTSMLDEAATAYQPAVRLDPPPQLTELGLPVAPPGLDNCEEMLFYMRQAGLPERFGDYGRHQQWVASDGIGWGESKCNNSAANSCCLGYWQNYLASHLRSPGYRDRIINECQVTSKYDIWGEDPLQKQKQACVTKVVYDVSGISPWRKA